MTGGFGPKTNLTYKIAVPSLFIVVHALVRFIGDMEGKKKKKKRRHAKYIQNKQDSCITLILWDRREKGIQCVSDST